MPSPAARPSSAAGVHATVRRRQPLDLVPDLLEALEPEVAAESVGELGGDHPVRPGDARRHDLLGEPA